jgi:hypothetical protein
MSTVESEQLDLDLNDMQLPDRESGITPAETTSITDRIAFVTERVSDKIIREEVGGSNWRGQLKKIVDRENQVDVNDVGESGSKIGKSRLKSFASYVGATGVVSGVSTATRYAFGPVGAIIGTVFSASYFARREGRKINAGSEGNSSYIQDKYTDNKERKFFGAGKRYTSLVAEKVTPIIESLSILTDSSSTPKTEVLPKDAVVKKKVSTDATLQERLGSEDVESPDGAIKQHEQDIADQRQRIKTLKGVGWTAITLYYLSAQNLRSTVSNQDIAGTMFKSSAERDNFIRCVEGVVATYRAEYPDEYDKIREDISVGAISVGRDWEPITRRQMNSMYSKLKNKETGEVAYPIIDFGAEENKERLLVESLENLKVQKEEELILLQENESDALFIGMVTGYRASNETSQQKLDAIRAYVKLHPEFFEDGNERMKEAMEKAVAFTTDARNRIVATQVRRSLIAGMLGIGIGVAAGELIRSVSEHGTRMATRIPTTNGSVPNITNIVKNHGITGNSTPKGDIQSVVGSISHGGEKTLNLGTVTLKPGDTVWGLLQNKGINPESKTGLAAIVSMFRNNPTFLKQAETIAGREGAGRTLAKMMANPNVSISEILNNFTPQQIIHAAHWIPSQGTITL